MPGLTVGVRWDPIDLLDELPPGAPEVPEVVEPAVEPAPPDESPAAEESPVGESPVAESPAPSVAPTESPEPTASPEPPAGTPEPPADPAEGRLSLVEPEQLGSVVEPVKARGGPTRIIVPLTLPERPGRYRLVATLHDATGVAYDAATQMLLPRLLIRVSGDVGAVYQVGRTVNATSEERFELEAGVVNVGATIWGHKRIPGRVRQGDDAYQATLVGHWVSLTPSAGDAVPADIRVQLPEGMTTGASARVTLAGTAPTAPGHYLLVIDVVDPELGSLAAHGIEPALVRVTIEAAPG
jgi:hypothetical protein